MELFLRRVSVGVLALTSLGGLCHAQGPCLPLSCTEVETLGENETWIPMSPSYTVDKRPVMFVQFVGFNYCANPRGTADWWYEDDDNPLHTTGNDANTNGVPDVFDTLLAMMDSYVADGFRRIIFEFPAGSAKSNTLISSAQWWTMPEWKRDAFEEHVGDWIESHPEISVGIYMDFGILDPCSLCMNSNAYDEITQKTSGDYCGFQYYLPCSEYTVPARMPDPEDSDDTCIFYQSVQPWIDLGVKEVWLEAGMIAPLKLWEFCYSPNYSGVKFGGEAVLVDGSDLDADAMELCPQFATNAFYDAPAADPGGTWDANPGEVGYGLIYPKTLTQLSTVIGRGFNIWLFNPGTNNSDSEKVKRLYSAGPIHIADFDGDGDVDASDSSAFDTAFLSGHPSGRSYNYYHGDIDQDGDVDTNDYFMFYIAYLDTNPYSVIDDYGDPDPDSAHP
jgi:hypothetical protein